MRIIRIAGVPEHFNLPWHLCIEAGEFEKSGIDLQWTDIPEGTGKLCQMLRDKETDMAIILTEGIIKDIIAGNDCKIVQVFVKSPLIWGIHVSAHAPYQKIEELKGKKVAISRYGSGSQLMALVNAKNNNWDTSKLAFEVVDTLDGAIEALTENKADYFMWERFMTQPIVDKGIFRRVADCPTPWVSFVVVVRNEVLQETPQTIETILDIINQTTAEFKQIPSIDRTLATRYNQKIEDIQQWLSLTQWSQRNLDERMLNKIQNQLLEFEIIHKKGTFVDIVST
jgi:ABC-type nitrate/sulfonate/bicarbonate transport system substrate-binding protein